MDPAAFGPIRERASIASRVPITTTLPGQESFKTRDLPTESKKVPTTLERIEKGQAALLIWHGYLATRSECHAALDTPVVPVPELERFTGLVRLAAEDQE